MWFPRKSTQDNQRSVKVRPAVPLGPDRPCAGLQPLVSEGWAAVCSARALVRKPTLCARGAMTPTGSHLRGASPWRLPGPFTGAVCCAHRSSAMPFWYSSDAARAKRRGGRRTSPYPPGRGASRVAISWAIRPRSPRHRSSCPEACRHRRSRPRPARRTRPAC